MVSSAFLGPAESRGDHGKTDVHEHHHDAGEEEPSGIDRHDRAFSV